MLQVLSKSLQVLFEMTKLRSLSLIKCKTNSSNECAKMYQVFHCLSAAIVQANPIKFSSNQVCKFV